jgi:small subunit ribosomal protein S4
VQLREKQKAKRIYGLSEKQFHLFFEKAERQKDITGTNLLILLERRLDNVVYRLGFVGSRSQGRHFVKHNHFRVNGKKINIPSYLIKAGDIIEVGDKSRNIKAISESIEAVVRRGVPQWLELEKENFKGRVKNFPVREDITMPIQEQLIVELYSK